CPPTMTPTPTQIGRRLARLRQGKGWTRYALAQRAGISRPHMTRLETGACDPTVGMLVRLAQALGVAVDELLHATEGRSDMMPRKRNFADALTAVFVEAALAGRTRVDVTARELHRRVGGYPPARGAQHRMPLCCQVMRQTMRAGDEVLQEPPK